MKRLLSTTILMLSFVSLAPIATLAQTKEGPATYFFSTSGTTTTGKKFDVTDATGTFRFGVKTNLGGNYRLITTYREIRFAGPLDVKSLQVGGEKEYPLGYKTGFFKNSSLMVRGAFDFELNQINNDVNGTMGFGWIKQLGTAKVFSLEPFMDMTLRDGADYVTIGLSLNITPPINK